MNATESWAIARASCQGVRNAARAKKCQDSSLVARLTSLPDNPDALVAAVADGMGSAPRSRTGARRACRSAVERAVQLIWDTRPTAPQHIETILNAALLQARFDVEAIARHDRRNLHDYATTLLLLVHLQGHIATIHVGDGAAIITADDSTVTLSTPQRGEFVNETTSITSSRSIQKAKIDIATPLSPVSHIALMTDGIMEISLDSKNHQPHPPFFDPIFEWLKEHDPTQGHPNSHLAEMLQSDAVRSKTQDDTTLLVAVRRESP